MSQNVRVVTLNALILVLDPETGVLPTDLDAGPVTVGPSSLVVGTLNPVDGEVSLNLGMVSEFPEDERLELRWQGMLETSGRLGIINVYNEVLLDMLVAGTVEVSIWTNHILEPDVVWVAVHES